MNICEMRTNLKKKKNWNHTFNNFKLWQKHSWEGVQRVGGLLSCVLDLLWQVAWKLRALYPKKSIYRSCLYGEKLIYGRTGHSISSRIKWKTSFGFIDVKSWPPIHAGEWCSMAYFEHHTFQWNLQLINFYFERINGEPQLHNHQTVRHCRL